MIKVKILKTKKFAYISEPSFDITIKSGTRERVGTLNIDFEKKQISLFTPTIKGNYMPYDVQEETKVILKHIFYYFCITECRKVKNIVSEHVEDFVYVDLNFEFVEKKSIIDYLMNCDLKDFNEYKKKEKMIANIKNSYDIIVSESKIGNSYIRLQPICDFSDSKKYVYRKILMNYLKKKGYSGRLEDISDSYNSQFKMEYPYTYALSPFAVYAFSSKHYNGNNTIEK